MNKKIWILSFVLISLYRNAFAGEVVITPDLTPELQPSYVHENPLEAKFQKRFNENKEAISQQCRQVMQLRTESSEAVAEVMLDMLTQYFHPDSFYPTEELLKGKIPDRYSKSDYRLYVEHWALEFGLRLTKTKLKKPYPQW